MSTVVYSIRYYPYGEAINVFAASVLANTATTADRAQPYLYGGKELERMHGLGEYDYGARRLQSHLPLWTTQDPCLEKYYATSPYAYCATNPIRFTDPTGCAHYYNQVTGKYYGSDNNSETDNICRLISYDDYMTITESNSDTRIQELEAASTIIEIDEDQITETVQNIIDETKCDNLEHQLFLILDTSQSQIRLTTGATGTNDKTKINIIEHLEFNLRTVESEDTPNPPFNILIGQIHTHPKSIDKNKTVLSEVSPEDVGVAANNNISVFAVETFCEKKSKNSYNVHYVSPRGEIQNKVGKTGVNVKNKFQFGTRAMKAYKH